MTSEDIIIKQVTNAIKKAIAKSTFLVQETAKELCAIDTGNLRSSIQADLENGIIYTNVDYAPNIEYGTVAHTITAKNGLSLAFKWKNAPSGVKTNKDGMVFLKKIKHPGTKAQPFMRPALWNNKKRILEIFKEEIQKI